MNFFLNSMAAGDSIALGSYAYLSVESRYLGAFLFIVGLYAVCQYGLPLYTGRIAYLGRAGGDTATRLMMMLVGNFLGAAIVGLLFLPTASGMDVLAIVSKKIVQPAQESFIRGFFCGALVFLAVDIFRRFDDPLGRYLGLLLGVPAFILSGFEHCVADMFYLAAAWRWGLALEAKSLMFMLMVILGNTIGALALNAIMPQAVPKSSTFKR